MSISLAVFELLAGRAVELDRPEPIVETRPHGMPMIELILPVVLAAAPLAAGALQSPDCDAVQVAAGSRHSLVLSSSGQVFGWGDNQFGQLGPEYGKEVLVPARITGFADIVAVAVGSANSLVLRRDGTVWAWGDNSGGQLGDGSNLSSALPVKVADLILVTAISSRSGHSLALRADQSLWSWGYNDRGQLGDGGFNNSNRPVSARGLGGVVAVAAGGQHSVALRVDGSVWTWGRNREGELGNGSTVDSAFPEPVPGLSDVVAIAAGPFHTLAVTRDGVVWAWGHNYGGTLGTGLPDSSLVPVRVVGADGIVGVAAILDASFAWRADGSWFAWGANQGRLGLGDSVDRYSASPGSGQATGFSGQWAHSLALGPAGEVLVTGTADNRVGNGKLSQREYFRPVPFLTPAMLVAAARYRSHIVHGGRVFSWGSNVVGQLGDGTMTSTSRAVLARELEGVISLSGGSVHTLAATAAGRAHAWGDNDYGQLGDGTKIDSSLPRPVVLIGTVVEVAAGDGHSLARLADGSVLAWGHDGSGRLGPGPHPDPSLPAVVQGVVDARGVSAGGEHSVALLADGRVLAWGRGSEGQLGDGRAMDSDTPVVAQLPGPSVAIAAGSRHTTALLGDGRVFSWGDNAVHQIAVTSTLEKATRPSEIAALDRVVAIAAGGNASLAIRDDGSLWVWGYVDCREHAILPTQLEAPPMRSASLGQETISRATDGILARATDGSVWVCGQNVYGRLGVPSFQSELGLVASRMDAAAVDQGNVLLAARAGQTDVLLSFVAAPSRLRRIYRDGDRATLGLTPLSALMTEDQYPDIGVLGAPGTLYYRLRSASACGLEPGP